MVQRFSRWPARWVAIGAVLAALSLPLSARQIQAGLVNLASMVTGTLPVANGGTGITSLGSNVATFLGTPSSANLLAAVTDETGTGALMFGTSPTVTTKLTVSNNAAALQAGPTGTVLHVSSADTVATIAVIDDYGTTPILTLRRASGTAASPTAVLSTNVLGRLTASGYGATAYAVNKAQITFVAEENWTDTANGIGIGFITTPNLGTTAVERLRITNAGVFQFAGAPALRSSIYYDEYGSYDDQRSWFSARRAFTGVPSTAGSIRDSVMNLRFQAQQTGDGRAGLFMNGGDTSAVTNKTITNAVNNGSGLIRLTATAHGYSTGNQLGVYGVTGTTEANGMWVVTAVDANTLDLVGSTFTNAYVSGGTVTNRGVYYTAIFTVSPTVNRGGFTGTAVNMDDVAAAVIFNTGTANGTDGLYFGRNTALGATNDFSNLIGMTANANYGIHMIGTYATSSFESAPDNGPIVGRFASNGTVPAVTDTSANSCGTGTQTIVGNDNAGKVTVIGSTGTSCTVTFHNAWANAPSCTASNETSANLARATSTTTTVILAGTFAQNDVIAYTCIGR
jgi:hypothetical protein